MSQVVPATEHQSWMLDGLDVHDDEALVRFFDDNSLFVPSFAVRLTK